MRRPPFPPALRVSVFEQWLIYRRCLFDQDLSAVHKKFGGQMVPWRVREPLVTAFPFFQHFKILRVAAAGRLTSAAILTQAVALPH